MIEKLEGQPPNKWELTAKLNEVIDMLNESGLQDFVKPPANHTLNLTRESLGLPPIPDLTGGGMIEGKPFVQPDPKEGDLCYFWDDADNGTYLVKFKSLNIGDCTRYPYLDINNSEWQHCQLAEINGKPNYPEHIKKLMK